MAQSLITDFVADLQRVIPMPDPVVEFGSYLTDADSGVGDLRPLFAGRPFTGTDMRPGPGVDRVDDLRALSFADGSVGTALCLDTLEHCADPPQACRELARVCSPDGGVAVISSVMLFGIHEYPHDYFRFTPDGFRALLEQGFDDVWVAGMGDPAIPTQVLGVGIRGGTLDLSLERLPTLAAAQAWYEAAPGKLRIGPLHLSPRELAHAVARNLRFKATRRLRSRQRIRFRA
jgi:SAM-dependent methyltransferase